MVNGRGVLKEYLIRKWASSYIMASWGLVTKLMAHGQPSIIDRNRTIDVNFLVNETMCSKFNEIKCCLHSYHHPRNSFNGTWHSDALTALQVPQSLICEPEQWECVVQCINKSSKTVWIKTNRREYLVQVFHIYTLWFTTRFTSQNNTALFFLLLDRVGILPVFIRLFYCYCWRLGSVFFFFFLLFCSYFAPVRLHTYGLMQLRTMVNRNVISIWTTMNRSTHECCSCCCLINMSFVSHAIFGNQQTSDEETHRYNISSSFQDHITEKPLKSHKNAGKIRCANHITLFSARSDGRRTRNMRVNENSSKYISKAHCLSYNKDEKSEIYIQ